MQRTNTLIIHEPHDTFNSRMVCHSLGEPVGVGGSVSRDKGERESSASVVSVHRLDLSVDLRSGDVSAREGGTLLNDVPV